MHPAYEEIWKNKDSKKFISNHINYALPIIEKNNIKRILDLGCGPCKGASFLLQEKGFDVYAFDASKTAIKKCSEKIDESKLKIGNMYETLPYENDFFDCVICFSAINHGTKKEITKCLAEISRILKKNGLFFVSHTPKKYLLKEKENIFINLVDKEKWFYSEKENTFVPVSGREKGVIHCFLEEKELESELEKFFELQKINDKKVIETDSRHYFAFGKNKK